MARVRSILVISLLTMVTSLTASAAAVSDIGRESQRQVTRRVAPAIQTPIAPLQQPSISAQGSSATNPPSAAVIPQPPEYALPFNADAQAGDTQPAVQPTPTTAQGTTAAPVAGGVLEPTPEPRGQAPIGLRIPAIGVDTGVQWVGVDDNGAMKVPSNYTDVAWYELGPRPGERGNAVMNGHLDSTTGTAVFWDLEALQPGDEVFVKTHGDQELRFIVTAIESFRTDEAPLDRIFGPSSERNLNLITCDGTFLRDIREYDQRLVVYTVLAEGQTVQTEG